MRHADWCDGKLEFCPECEHRCSFANEEGDCDCDYQYPKPGCGTCKGTGEAPCPGKGKKHGCLP